MFNHSDILHGPSHTIIGALVIGTIAMLIGKPISEFAIRLFSPSKASISWKASWAGAFTGTLSHIVLDSFMHSDMRPLSPFSDANSLLGMVSLEWLHLGLVISGFVGLVFIGYFRVKKRDV